MIPSCLFRRFAFAFGGSFAGIYVIAVAKDLALFTVFPSLGIVLIGTQHTNGVTDPVMGFLAPAMYWYGWAATAALGALMFGLMVVALPKRWTEALDWTGWVWLAPVISMVACVYLTLPWFRL
jgi:hypothetical protein